MVDISHIKNFAVVGAGLMGSSIAHVALMAGFEKVIINDISMESLHKSEKLIEDALNTCEAMNNLSEGDSANILMGRLVKEIDLAKAVAKADFVVEAVPEVMEIKQEIFKKLGEYTPTHALLATNTSIMSITKITEPSGRSELAFGMHFCAPVINNRLIEVIKGKKTSDDILDIGVAIAQKFPCFEGKRYIARLEKESPGFILNRCLAAIGLYLSWIGEQALEKGISLEQLDADLSDSEESMGLCEASDFVGLDVAYHGAKALEESLSPDFAPTEYLTEMVKSGNLGAKTGKGYFEWPEGVDIMGIKGRPKLNKKIKAGLIDLNAMMAVGLNEGCRLLEEGIVSGYKTIDDALYAGLKLPGLFIAGKSNYEQWSKLLEDLAEKTGKNYLKPCNLMKSGGFVKMRKSKPPSLTV